MKKAIACLLALPLALAACGVQNVPAQTAQPTDTPVETPAPTTASTAPVEEPAASSEPAPESTPAQGEQMPRPLTRRRRNPSLHRIPKRWAVSLIRPCKARKNFRRITIYRSFCCTKPLKARAKAVPIHKMIITFGKFRKVICCKRLRYIWGFRTFLFRI